MVDQRREVGVKVRSDNVFRIEDPTGLAKLDHQKEQAAARARERAANAEERAARMRRQVPAGMMASGVSNQEGMRAGISGRIRMEKEQEVAAKARERAAIAEERAARARKVTPLYAGGYHGPGTPDFGGRRKDVANMKMEKEQEVAASARERAAIAEENEARKENLNLMQAKATATQTEASNARMLSASILQVNMSLLGLMFGYQNVLNLINMSRDSELQELQMKDKKSKKDKERIKDLRKEQIETQKNQRIMMGMISIVQLLASAIQIANVMKVAGTGINAMLAKSELAAARSTTVEGDAAIYSASANTAKWTAKAGPFAMVMLALLLGVAATAFAFYQGKKAATGAVIPGGGGGQMVLAGERQPEVFAPDSMLRNIIRSEMGTAAGGINNLGNTGGRGGGGVTVINNNIQTMDSKSFNEFLSMNEEEKAITGWT